MDALTVNYWKFVNYDQDDVTDEVAYLHDLSPIDKVELFEQFSKMDGWNWLNEMGAVFTGEHDGSIDLGGQIACFADDVEHVKNYQYGDTEAMKQGLIEEFGNVYLFDWLYQQNLGNLNHLMELCGFEWMGEY